MDQLFAPLGLRWQAVSPRAAVRLRMLWCAFVLFLTLGLTLSATALRASGGLTWFPALSWVLLGCGVVGLVLAWVYAGRRARSWAYAERAEDLYIRHGVMILKLVAVPYGRMQFVDVTAGPLERWLGLASVEMHTATPGTRAVIPGLPPDEAARMRDQLTALGQAQAAGL